MGVSPLGRIDISFCGVPVWDVDSIDMHRLHSSVPCHAAVSSPLRFQLFP